MRNGKVSQYRVGLKVAFTLEEDDDEEENDTDSENKDGED